MKATTYKISSGDRGIESTLRRMRSIVMRAAKDPGVISWAHSVVRGLPPRNKDAEAKVFLDWVRNHTRYTNDPVHVELVKTPEVMLREIRRHGKSVGDCDDLVVLLATGLTVVGLPVDFIVLGEGSSSEYTHVMLSYESPVRGMVTMDPITKHAPGWFPPSAGRVGHMGMSGGLKSGQGGRPRRRGRLAGST